MLMPERKHQRVRDPLHNLIEFDEGDPFERMLWRVIGTKPFQRLRRVRQLGFSDLVFPGATHSRFAHSLGVFHTARQLMRVVRKFVPDRPEEKLKAEAALAAALLHDVGHGAFSHAFEQLGKEFGWRLLSEHESHSEALIRNVDPGSIGEVLNRHDDGFADMVAAAVRGGPSTVYQSIVSSQFDADRLDYIRRDRLMTGTSLAAIDFDWLLANLEIHDLPLDESGLRRQTFVLGPKAIYAAEGFVNGLFQMYPTVYFHKTTRGAEKLAQAMLKRIFELARDNGQDATGLPASHPLIRVAECPEDLQVLSDLDDSVVWGALPMLLNSRDRLIAEFAGRLQQRKLFGAIDLHSLHESDEDEGERERMFRIAQDETTLKIQEWCEKPDRRGRILLDVATRKPYKRIEEEGPMNQIWLLEGSSLVDLGKRSRVVGAIKPFRAFRAYAAKDDYEAQAFLKGAVSNCLAGG